MLRWLLPLALLLPAAAFAAPADFTVAPNGNDAWSGRLAEPNRARTDGPLASLAGAQRAVRALKAGRPARPITVLVRGGTYRIDRPVVFSPEDSGTPAAPITYAAAPGERPVIDGGRRITGFRQQGNLWTAALPEVAAGRWYFQQLFVNGKRAQRARTPNEGFFRVAGYDAATTDAQGRKISRQNTAFRFAPGDVRRWERLEDAVAVVYHSWETSLLRIKAVDLENSTVEFTGPAGWRFGYWGPKQRYHVENVAEALDAPGEWYLNRQTGVLSYFPLPGQKIETAEVVAPTTDELLRFDGIPEMGLPVEHVALRGLAFRHADWTLEPQGHSDAQAVFRVPAAIIATGARDCALEECEIAHVGTYGIWLRRGSSGCRLVKNHLFDLGAGAIRVGEMEMPRDAADFADGNLVENNYIHDYGEVYAAGVGVLVGQSSDNRIRHNEIHDGYYSGMSLGWNWGQSPTHAHRNLVEFNHIHHVMRGLLSDGAGIYTLGTSPGTAIRNNVIHDVFAYEQPPIAWGIYLDAESNQILVENNLCYNVLSGGLMMHNGGFANTVRNNVFARCAHQTVWRAQPRGEPATFERNVCWLTQGDLFLTDGSPDVKSTWDRNLYWRTDGKAMLFNDEALEDWQALGLDRTSLIADPQFIAPEKDDFRLKPTSPAITRLGFQPFDPGQAGLSGDPAWTALPRQVRFAATVLPPAPDKRVTGPIAEGFEETAPGEQPARAHTYLGEIAGGSVAVSGERAAAGQRSLKFTDAPGLKNEWDPHCFYQPRFRRGAVRLRFQLWTGAAAIPWVEWRTGGFPYAVGPSLKVDAKGGLLANGKPLVDLPREQWVGIEITCALGKAATGTYDLTVALPGQQPRRFAGLACDPKFARLEWLGFISLATTDAGFFVDDLSLEPVTP